MDNFLKEINYQLSQKKIRQLGRLINIRKIDVEGDSKAHLKHF